MRMLKRHEGCPFSSGVGEWAPELHMATALDRSTHFLAAFNFVATTKAWEKLNKCAKAKWKQTTTRVSKRDEVALRLTNDNDEIWAWTPCADCAGQVSALSLLSSSSAKRPKLERSWGNCAKPKWKQVTRHSKTWRRKPFFWRTNSSSLIADQRSAPVLSAPTDLLREQIHWSTAPTVLGQTSTGGTAKPNGRPGRSIWSGSAFGDKSNARPGSKRRVQKNDCWKTKNSVKCCYFVHSPKTYWRFLDMRTLLGSAVATSESKFARLNGGSLKRPYARYKNMQSSTNNRLDQLVRNMQSEVTWHNYSNGFTRLKFWKICTGSSSQKSNTKIMILHFLLSL